MSPQVQTDFEVLMRYFINHTTDEYITFYTRNLPEVTRMMEERMIKLGYHEVSYLRYILFRLFRVY